jgi:hypothetical protein
MTLRVCAEPDCPALVTVGTRNGRCATHRRTFEQARGTAAARGYGTDHRKTRARWALLVAAGNVNCRRCGTRIDADAAWDLGHPDAESAAPLGPEHRDACNRAAAGRSAH